MQAPIFIYTALPCEAKPLIDHFRLKKDLGVDAFAVFTGAGICLTVTGIGKSAMAAGVAYSQARYAPNQPPVLLNIGIAGHRDHPLGELFLAHKITDAGRDKAYYPPLVFKPPCRTESLETYAKAQLAYHHASLCDMEASAFYETAIRFTTGEVVQTLKVISDNAAHPATHITPATASAQIAAHIGIISPFITQLQGLAQTLALPEPEGLKEILARHHFTSNTQQQLSDKLRRWQLITGQPIAVPSIPELKDAKALLRWLDERLQEQMFYL